MDKSFDLSRLLKNHKKHKSKPMQFVSVAGGVQKRLETNIKNRKSSRLTVFDNLRNLTNVVGSPARVSDKKSKEEHRRLQLEKWKEEKEKKKREAATQKKKPFLVGLPPSKVVPPPPPPKPLPSTSGRVTRSQSNKAAIKQKAEPKLVKMTKSFAPKHASFQAPQIKNLTVLPKLAPPTKKKDNIVYKFDPVLPNTLKQNTKSTRSKTVSNNTVQPVIRITRTTAKDLENKPKGRNPRITKVLSPRSPIPKSESSSEEKLRSPKSPVEIPMTPEQIVDEAKKLSPCVTMSRGKDNARKEMKKKIDEGLLDEDTSDMDSVNHFRRQLNSEIKRMTEMCEIWEKIQEQTCLSDSIQELVLSAVGQARLLMTQKLAQFGSLVERCARPDSSQALVTPADLAGFWDMVFMQVENIDMRFKKLEELKSRGWVEDKPVEVKKKVVNKANVNKKPNKPTAGPSRLREMIAAARKAKMEADTSVSTTSLTPVRPSTESKTFEAGFFSVQSPVRCPAPSPRVTPAKPTLLKAVLSSEAKKSASKSTSFAMLRASVLSKNMEHDGIALLPQTPINLNATPGRSILKSVSISEKKSSKKVLFDDSDNDIKENSDSAEEPFIGFKTLPESDNNADSGVSSMDIEKENKESSRRKSKLFRQEAVTDDWSPVMTRSRRKSMNTPKEDSENCAQEKTPKRSTRKKKTLQENNSNVNSEKSEIDTPKRSTGSRRSRGLKNIET
ncbi:unnamed protein product [Chilo suppressalis]|uniref:Guanylate kinase-associated protein mars n=1 Tax=Chilo suppressalis TaxID=168631 RepID=A0ABN8L1S4_CHISP|nr:unnamed protein product [Chilo suppressalis]